MDDVSGSHDLTVGRDEHAGPDLGERREAAGALDVLPLGPDHDDGRVDLPEDVANALSAGGAGEAHCCGCDHQRDCESFFQTHFLPHVCVIVANFREPMVPKADPALARSAPLVCRLAIRQVAHLDDGGLDRLVVWHKCDAHSPAGVGEE